MFDIKEHEIYFENIIIRDELRHVKLMIWLDNNSKVQSYI